MAYDHLIAYLSGTGERPYDEPIEQFFADNPRAARRVADHIRNAGTRSGIWRSENPESAPIRQRDYDNQDWLLSLGNIDEVQWELLGEIGRDGCAMVRIS